MGHRPADVPDWTGNVWTSVRHVAGLPLEPGGGIKCVGTRYGNTANTLRLTDYATGIVYATYSVRRGLDATVRVNNLWDKAFKQWADIYLPTQVQLGEPRRVEVSAVASAWPEDPRSVRAPEPVAADSLPALAEGCPRAPGGRILIVMSGSRLVDAWLYYALHDLNLPGLAGRATLRAIVVLVPLLAGLAFSLTGVVLGWRRLRGRTKPAPTG